MKVDAPEFAIGDTVLYAGKTYRFPGTVCAVTDDGQYVVRAHGAPNGDYAGMKHIYGPSQLQPLASLPGAGAGEPVGANEMLRNAATAARPIIAALIDQERNVETWGLLGRLAAIDAALAAAPASPALASMPGEEDLYQAVADKLGREWIAPNGVRYVTSAARAQAADPPF